ncbi:MAG: precorrin-6A reductase [Fibrobacterota bacterium]
MILLVAGTSETAPLANAMLRAGHKVLVSLATEVDLELAHDPALTVRRGRLDKAGLQELITRHAITQVVDASHPFAQALHRELKDVCAHLGIQRIRYERPETDLGPGVEVLENHEAAAASAVRYCKPILLTTGSRNLVPYVNAAAHANIPLYARVLPATESELACRLAGFDESRIEFARGPFSVDQTRALLRRWHVGVLIAKNGGIASGLAERLEAARLEGVVALIVRRPDQESGAAGSFTEVMERLGVPNPERGHAGVHTDVL